MVLLESVPLSKPSDPVAAAPLISPPIFTCPALKVSAPMFRLGSLPDCTSSVCTEAPLEKSTVYELFAGPKTAVSVGTPSFQLELVLHVPPAAFVQALVPQ